MSMPVCSRILHIDVGTAAAGFGTLTIAIAAGSLTAFVLLMTLGDHTHIGGTRRAAQPLILLPAVFVMGLLSAFMFEITSSNQNCSVAVVELAWASVPFALATTSMILALSWIVLFYRHYDDGVLTAIRIAFIVTLLIVGLFVNGLLYVAARAVNGPQYPHRILEDGHSLYLLGPSVLVVGYLLSYGAWRKVTSHEDKSYELKPGIFVVLSVAMLLIALVGAAEFFVALHRWSTPVTWGEDWAWTRRMPLGILLAFETFLLPRTWKKQTMELAAVAAADVAVSAHIQAEAHAAAAISAAQAGELAVAAGHSSAAAEQARQARMAANAAAGLDRDDSDPGTAT